VGTRAGLDGCSKSCSPPGFDSPYVQPIASRYADYTIPVHPLVIKGALYSLTEFVNFEHFFSVSLILIVVSDGTLEDKINNLRGVSQ